MYVLRLWWWWCVLQHDIVLLSTALLVAVLGLFLPLSLSTPACSTNLGIGWCPWRDETNSNIYYATHTTHIPGHSSHYSSSSMWYTEWEGITAQQQQQLIHSIYIYYSWTDRHTTSSSERRNTPFFFFFFVGRRRPPPHPFKSRHSHSNLPNISIQHKNYLNYRVHHYRLFSFFLFFFFERSGCVSTWRIRKTSRRHDSMILFCVPSFFFFFF